VGVGNVLRGDDGFGPLLARALDERGLPALDGGPAPENLTGPILRAAPEVLLLADAADFGEQPGALRLVDPSELDIGSGSTHDPGFDLLLDYLGRNRQMDVALVAVQPATLEFGAVMSPAVEDALVRAAEVIAAESGG
jgi:hydrogenase 3 maturation protease